ncbi:hypothetical protein [Methylomonas rivi]|uniref:Uncharacterized protein n=1 Tax=Methylomonas rivi TaxID=2952226 RepID=A0ABT1U7L6_9GAMM|nr:hypothetical protein [Methylomonas sp. WSC-6]MBS4053023.1 hypothetical protein [Methylomonas sp.]MCQ8129847.1 hypothetical protein [Methylomonas sp. WSC-6]
MNRYLLNRLSAIFWLVLLLSLFAKKAAANNDYTASVGDIGDLMPRLAVTGKA